MSQPSEPERLIGPYRLLHRLGAGGMGEVFLARDDRLGRQVAIKRAHTGKASPAQRQRFQREARATAQLSHPAIVAVFDVTSDGESDWIVMELIDGPTLRDYLTRQGPPPLAKALAWATQIAEGLGAAHAAGILHRDLKAENVMIAASGHAKIIDLGLARLADDAEGLTPDHGLLGTLRSMAPEQARGLAIDHRADLFSFGVLLYELLAGRRPFDGGGPVDLLLQLTSRAHPPLGEGRPDLPPRLVQLVDRLLAKAPEARPASAGAVAQTLGAIGADLASAQHDRPVGGESTVFEPAPASSARATPVAPVLPAGPAKSRWRGWAAAALGLALAGNLVYLLATRAPSAQAPTDPPALVQSGLAKLERWARPGQTDAAIADFLRALEADPRSAPANAGLARAYWRKSRSLGKDEPLLRQALATAEQAVRLDAYLAAGQVSLGLASVELGRLDEAAAAFDRAATLDPANGAGAQGRGDLALAHGDLEGAEAAYRAALVLGERAELHNSLGSVLYRGKRYPEAEAAFRRAIAVEPDVIHGYRNLAAVRHVQDDAAGAATALQQAIAIEPNSSLYTSLGTILYYQGRYADAHGAFEQALEVARGSTSNPTLWANLGDGCRMLPGHEEEGRVAYRRAVQLLREAAPRQPTADFLSRLALYSARGGEVDEARRALAALASFPALELTARSRAILAFEALGERQAALAAFGDALRAGLPPSEIAREPELDAFRTDPGYHRLAASAAR